MLREDIELTAKWQLAPIVQLLPRHDGLVRVVSLWTKSGVFKHPVSKSRVLPKQKSDK